MARRSQAVLVVVLLGAALVLLPNPVAGASVAKPQGYPPAVIRTSLQFHLEDHYDNTDSGNCPLRHKGDLLYDATLDLVLHYSPTGTAKQVWYNKGDSRYTISNRGTHLDVGADGYSASDCGPPPQCNWRDFSDASGGYASNVVLSSPPDSSSDQSKFSLFGHNHLIPEPTGHVKLISGDRQQCGPDQDNLLVSTALYERCGPGDTDLARIIGRIVDHGPRQPITFDFNCQKQWDTGGSFPEHMTFQLTGTGACSASGVARVANTCGPTAVVAPVSVERATDVELDGSGSQASPDQEIKQYIWDFSPSADCKVNLPKENAHLELVKPVSDPIKLLCSVTATLTVVDSLGLKASSGPQLLRVKPRSSAKWTVTDYRGPPQIDATGNDPIAQRFKAPTMDGTPYEGAISVSNCAEPESKAQNDIVKWLCPLPIGGSRLDHGYSISRVEDPGPFRGFSYISDIGLYAQRRAILNPFFFLRNRMSPNAHLSFYDANENLASQNMPIDRRSEFADYLKAITQHETDGNGGTRTGHMEAGSAEIRRMNNAGKSANRALEGTYTSPTAGDHTLKLQADLQITGFENEIIREAADPLNAIGTTYKVYFFVPASTTGPGWVLYQCRVGGAPSACVLYTSQRPPVTGSPGNPLRIDSAAFFANETVVGELHSQPLRLGSFRANALGQVTASIVLPVGLTLGGHVITLIGQSSQVMVEIPITVIPSRSVHDPIQEVVADLVVGALLLSLIWRGAVGKTSTVKRRRSLR